MFCQALAHALVAVSAIAEFCAAWDVSEVPKALGVFGITRTATVEQVQAHPFALVLWASLEHNCGGQHAINGSVFKSMKTGVSLLKNKIKISEDITGNPTFLVITFLHRRWGKENLHTTNIESCHLFLTKK